MVLVQVETCQASSTHTHGMVPPIDQQTAATLRSPPANSACKCGEKAAYINCSLSLTRVNTDLQCENSKGSQVERFIQVSRIERYSRKLYNFLALLASVEQKSGRPSTQ